jgi:hypothetical protein
MRAWRVRSGRGGHKSGERTQGRTDEFFAEFHDGERRRGGGCRGQAG